MRSIWRRFLLPAIGAVVAGAFAGPSRADVILYEGQSSEASGLKLQSWGSGSAADTEEYVYTGVKSIKVKTHGRYQGARLVLPKPANLTPALGNPNSYLELAVYPPETKSSTTGMRGMGTGSMMGPGSGGMMGGIPGGLTTGRGGQRGSTGMGGMPPGMPGGRQTGQRTGGTTGRAGGQTGRTGSTGMPGGSTGMPGGMPGMRGGQGAGGVGGASGMGGLGGLGQGQQRSLIVDPTPIRNVRLVLVTSDGKQIDVNLPMENGRPARDGWRTLAVPLSAMPELKKTDGQVVEVRIFGDSVGQFYVGRLTALEDNTPIRVDEIQDRTIAVNDTITFNGSADGGVSQLKYEWTVVKPGEKAPEPMVADGEGKSFAHRFRRSGDYTVYLTVRDVHGLKKPVTTKANVHVTL